jgi:23S rRNA pseudouridine1911/1915/1917 synthase
MTSEFEPDGESHRLIVDSGLAGKRLDVFLADHFPARSRAELKRLIQSSNTTVNGKVQKPAHIVREADIVEIQIPVREVTGPIPEEIPLDVLYEDDDLIAINKPSGMVVHPAKGHWSGTLTAALAFRFQNLSSVAGPSRPGIVHRLDRDTSGVILVAKNDRAHLRLCDQFARRTVEKEYFAICRGSIDRDRDSIEQPIGVHPYHRERMAIRGGHPTSRKARTVFEVVERLRGFMTFRVFPKTGRTHQIRVHLSHIGCPILCDPLYSGQSVITLGEVTGDSRNSQILLDRLALHALRIRVSHPITNDRLEFLAPVPIALDQALEQLRRFRGRKV